jgi:hypothetical protein
MRRCCTCPRRPAQSIGHSPNDSSIYTDKFLSAGLLLGWGIAAPVAMAMICAEVVLESANVARLPRGRGGSKLDAARIAPRIAPACRDFRDSSRVLTESAGMNGARGRGAQRGRYEATTTC